MSRRVASLLLAIAVTNAVGCKKKVVTPPEVVPPEPVQHVESRLQITSMNPGSVEANTPLSAKVFGGGFDAASEVTVGSTAAATHLVDPNTLEVDVPGLVAGSYEVVVTNGAGDRATLPQGLIVRGDGQRNDCAYTRVFFEFDSASLNREARNALDNNVACYQRLSGQVRVSGHADERGTTDYNLALGQRRAQTVKTHLTGQGVAPGRISTVSYGEEKPLERGSTESAWAQNRRAEVNAD